jgi:hypothetical protein
VNLINGTLKINFNFLLDYVDQVPHAVVIMKAVINEVLFEFTAAELGILFGDRCVNLV